MPSEKSATRPCDRPRLWPMAKWWIGKRCNDNGTSIITLNTNHISQDTLLLFSQKIRTFVPSIDIKKQHNYVTDKIP